MNIIKLLIYILSILFSYYTLRHIDIKKGIIVSPSDLIMSLLIILVPGINVIAAICLFLYHIKEVTFKDVKKIIFLEKDEKNDSTKGKGYSKPDYK